MRPIATDIANFEELRKTGQIYVDKTAYFHRMITDPSRRYFFCARPRRFGKSLDPLGMLYQAGYLMIKSYDCGIYMLGVPDEEVRRDLATLMTGAAANQDMKWIAL